MKNIKLYVLIGLIVLVIGLSIYMVLAKKKKDANAQLISDAIAQGVGAKGTDIDLLLYPIAMNTTYQSSKADLQKLHDADGGTFLPNNPDNFMQVFQGKSKAVIKKIVHDFQATYGIKLNDYINTVFTHIWGYDTTRYNQLLDLIRASA